MFMWRQFQWKEIISKYNNRSQTLFAIQAAYKQCVSTISISATVYGQEQHN